MSTRYYVYAGPGRALVDNHGFAGMVGACTDARARAARAPGIEHTAVRCDEHGDTDEARYLLVGGQLTAWVR